MSAEIDKKIKGAPQLSTESSGLVWQKNCHQSGCRYFNGKIRGK